MSAPEIANAKSVCGICPVRRQCLLDGMAEDWGVWGGFTRPERQRALDALGTVKGVMSAYDAGMLESLVVLP